MMLNFILLEFIVDDRKLPSPKRLYENDWIDYDGFSIEIETKEQLKKEISLYNLKPTKDIKLLNNPYHCDYFSSYYASFTNNQENYNKFFENNGISLIPLDYYNKCCNISLDKKGIKIHQIHNKEILNDYHSEYLFLDISFDQKFLKLSSFQI